MRDDHTPTIKELLDDPIILAVMRRDGVSRHEVSSLMNTMRDRLRNPVDRLAA
jgi:hypothetical protein